MFPLAQNLKSNIPLNGEENPSIPNIQIYMNAFAKYAK
jgi:hypothetical protein